LIAPWCFLRAALALYYITTGFGFCFYWRLNSASGDFHEFFEKITEGREANFSRIGQLLHALDMLAWLKILPHDVLRPVCRNRLRIGPLEHTFEKARIRCCDVNTMQKMMDASVRDTLARAVDLCFDLGTVSHRRVSLESSALSVLKSSLPYLTEARKELPHLW
jgi:hypothetical protein